MPKFPSRLQFRHLIYSFLILMLVVFITTGLVIYGNINDINLKFRESVHAEAVLEMDRAIRETLYKINDFSLQLSNWDEIHQQIGNPAYYQYWKTQRLKYLNLPEWITNIDIHDANLNILGNKEKDETGTLAAPGDHYIIENDQLYFISIYPIRSRRDQQTILGYLSTRSDVIAALKSSKQLLVTDPASLKVSGIPRRHIMAPNVLQELKFSTRSTPLFDQLLQTTTMIYIYACILILIFTLLVYVLAHTTINLPLRWLTDYVQNLKFGSPAKSDKIFRVEEFNKLKESIDDYQNELARINCSLDQKNDELWQMAHRDVLTGIANRRAYEQDWKSYMSIADNKRLDFSYILIDCNHFKSINDTYGHETGDKLIITLSDILLRSLREGDKLYRIGGDEFATILWNTDSHTAEKIAQRCLDNVRNYSFQALGITEPVTVSIGIATHTRESVGSIESLPRYADIAMYHAKKTGSGNITHYDANLSVKPRNGFGIPANLL